MPRFYPLSSGDEIGVTLSCWCGLKFHSLVVDDAVLGRCVPAIEEGPSRRCAKHASSPLTSLAHHDRRPRLGQELPQNVPLALRVAKPRAAIGRLFRQDGTSPAPKVDSQSLAFEEIQAEQTIDWRVWRKRMSDHRKVATYPANSLKSLKP
jgi:hypothetical protein